ncbi:SIS domain-containing protein [Gordonia sp. HNM0687]|uniref:SIS domain-containing protein n=1 Tax=Gordonia mangrovi TaxID=2665643 RepID=A0A6L7GMU3_9ACTN|nr:MurR/RpiR family transcriptional regulator [Gordonia mangrovi]MXP20095.1 SIS domain-containing protein [Gordonia mangrovi]UVF79294.1 MurR/RpiR family transcriptional regulator [Gordonia mangrovi]
MTEGPPSEGTVAQRIRQVRHTLAPGEMRVVAALTDSYPTAGLVPIAQLAAEADVSAPTALRLVGKLGFSGYGAFQEALREEVQTRLFSPVAVYPDADESVAEESALSSAATLYTDGLRSTIGSLVVSELQEAVSAVADPANSVMCVGGRFSSVLATQLARYLHMLRTDVVEVPPNSGDQMAAQIDVGTQTVVILFDYRRYQHATIDWGMAAADRGAQLILVTDRYLSPLASLATWVFPTSHAGPGPFDSMTHGFMLVELLVSLVAKELGGPARDRLAGFEELQLAAEEPRRQGPGNRRRG